MSFFKYRISSFLKLKCLKWVPYLSNDKEYVRMGTPTKAKLYKRIEKKNNGKRRSRKILVRSNVLIRITNKEP